MRAALWIAVLLAAFVLAWQLEERWAGARRAERDAAYSRIAGEADGLPPGFGRVVVGEPSGAAPIEVARPADANEPGRMGAAAGDRDARAPAPRNTTGASDLRRHVVRKGESLSKICQAHYGTARKEVVEAVASANGLTNAGAIREGQELVLPSLDELRASPR